MGRHNRTRTVPSLQRLGRALILGLGLLTLGACSAEDEQQIKNLAMPTPVTEEAPHIFELWRWSWLAAILVGIVVWGLIGWCVVRYRRRREDEVPVQTRYNLPLEVFYTIAPVMMVVVFFYWTVVVQNEVLDTDNQQTDYTIEVVGQQWSWTFNHGVGDRTAGELAEGEFRYDQYAYEVGTVSDLPTLVLPVDQTVRFNLHSPDVIHSFWVPAFLLKMDVIPGRDNNFTVTPTKTGTYQGKCAELCGTYHSRMLFNVEVVSQAEYEQYLQRLENQGRVSQDPLLGGSDARTQAGLEDDEDGGQE